MRHSLGRSWWSGLATVLVLSSGWMGCSGKPIDPSDTTVSIVYGYIDMKDAPSNLEWVSLKRYGEEKDEYYSMGHHEGLVFHIGIKPGSYQVEKFGGMGGVPMLTRKPYEYNFGTKGRNATAVRIHRPGAYYFGSYKYIDRPAGMFSFSADKFEMQRQDTPSEKEILRKLLAHVESDSDLKIYVRQIALLRARLAEL